MDRKQQLEHCKRCVNQQFDMNKGILCGLTNDYATFEGECKDFEPDEVAIRQLDREAAMHEPTIQTASADRTGNWQTKTAETRSQMENDRIVKRSASWFYWIAGLSLINSILFLTGTGWGFIFGLGITQITDRIMIAYTETYSFMTITPSFVLLTIFVAIGYFAGKHSKAAFIIGMILYGLDALLFLLWGGYLALAFHAFALFMIFKGFNNIEEGKKKKESLSVLDEDLD
ncbi:MAG: hypothetical protein AAFX87_17200 [Bacteroidota bacterium]